MLDQSATSLNKKIRNAQLSQFNYILVAGEDESKLGLMDVRNARESGDATRLGKMNIDQFVSMLRDEYPNNVPQPRFTQI
jgi:threonyl-tRNA synthetase